MSVPNYAYIYGTTPSSGGQNAIYQAIKSAFLSVNTTIASAISSTGSQAVTPASMTNIGVGTGVWINWGLSDEECVSVTAVLGGTFTANFTKTHAINSVVTCGSTQLGLATTWSLVSTMTLTGINFTVVSSPTTTLGDIDYIPIMVGHGSTPATTIGFATADDIDVSGSNAQPQQVSNYYSGGPYINESITIQDASFSWWICVCEFGMWVETDVAGTYSSIFCCSLRTPQSTNERGVGATNAAIVATASSVTILPDVSSRISPGQKVNIINNSHSHATANYTAVPVLMTVASVTGNGTSATIVFSDVGGVPHAFDTGALVGLVPTKVTIHGSSLEAAPYLTRNNDGSWTGYASQNGTVDTGAVTTYMESYESPMQKPNPLYAGELDMPVLQSNGSGYNGICGFLYCAQYFTKTSVSNQDAFADPSIASVWKAFPAGGGSHCPAMGPLLNPLNTLASMTPVASTPFVP